MTFKKLVILPYLEKNFIEDTHDTIAVGRLKFGISVLTRRGKEFFKTDEKFKILEDLFEKAMSFESWSKLLVIGFIIYLKTMD